MSCPRREEAIRLIAGLLDADGRLELVRHAQGCSECRDALGRAVVADVVLEHQLPELSASIESYEPPDTKNVPPPGRRFWWPIGALALAGAVTVALVHVILPPADRGQTGEEITYRGGDAPEPSVTLALAVTHDNVTERHDRLRAYQIGDAVQFLVSSAAPTQIALWMRHDGELRTLALTEAGPDPSQVSDAAAPLRFALPRPGRYEFFVSSEGAGECQPASCVKEMVEVSP